VRIAIREEFFHVAGAVHGSHYFKALDDAAFFAVASLDPNHFPLTASFNMYFERPVSSGTLVAVGEIVQRARRVLLAESRLHDDDGRELARGSGTFMPSSTPWDELG
jgi:uncharacterized protein (TIGR00369 family)